MTAGLDEAGLRDWLVEYLVTNVGCDRDEVDCDASLNDLGVGSRDAVVLSGELAELVGRPVSPVEFWQHPTVNALAAFLARGDADPGGASEAAATADDRGHSQAGDLHEPIAVIGVGCRFPGDVSGPDELWEFLSRGGSGVGQVPAARWERFEKGSADDAAAVAETTRWGAYLSGIDGFDAEFFEISAREAAMMDPQQRLLLEVAWEALEHAGIAPGSLRRSQTGVFAGACSGEYGQLASTALQDVDAWTNTGGALSIISNRLSYVLDLRGPSVTVDTACSSSLVAIHLACQSLRAGDSQLAIAAGVNVLLSPAIFRGFDQAGALSATGQCHAFDAAADGFVRGEGCGAVVLKRLSDAVRDGDRVLAVVRGSAVNQDGRSNGLMAPNPAAQMAVLRDAYASAALTPLDVDYVETHGTGTLLGDPIEARALGSVLGRGRRAEAPLLIGAVKSNIGHLEAAAGIAGFIKAALAVERGRIPANLGFTTPNPHIPFEQLRLKVVAENQDWPKRGQPRRAGVSSFGFGGTNAHVVLEQGPESVAPQHASAPAAVTTLVVSGKTPQRLAANAAALADWMDGAGSAVALADVAHTVNHHRTHYSSFGTVCARERAQAAAGLRALAAGQVAPGVVAPHDGPCAPGTVFVYSGQGSQWLGMGRQLLADEPAFAAAVAELEPDFVAAAGFSLSDVLTSANPLVGIDRIQPVLVGVQLALTRLWRHYGVVPDAVVGHSMGEVTAAVVAGALSPAQGLRVIATRSRLMARLSGQGAMALLELDAAAVGALIADYPEVTIAVYASPRQTVIAGPPGVVDELCARVQRDNRLARRVDVDVASHHPTIDPILGDLRAALADLVPGRAVIPIVSTVYESPGSAAVVFDAEHWVSNLRNPVRFHQAITAAGRDYNTFVEVSPHPLLLHAISEIHEGHHHTVPTLQRDTDDTLTFHTNLNATHTARPPQTPHLPEPHPHIPSAPWQHTRHWAQAPAAAAAVGGGHPLLGQGVTDPTTGTRVWERRLSPALLWLGDHRVDGICVLPGTAYAEIALAAAMDAFDGDDAAAWSIGELHLDQLMPIHDDSTTVVTTLTGDASRARVEIRSRTGDSDWTLHASATLQRGAGAPPAPPVPGDGPGTEVSAEELYTRLRGAGQQHGAAFRGVESVRVSDCGVLTARVGLPAEAARSAHAFVAHPVMLDIALQVLGAGSAVTDLAAGGSDTPVALPVRFAGVRVCGDVTRAVQAVATLRPAPAADRVVGEVTLIDGDGAVCLHIAEVEAVLLSAPGTGEGGRRYYELAWEQVDLDDDPARVGGSVLIVADRGDDDGLLTAAGALLAQRTDRCEWVSPADDTATIAAIARPDVEWESIVVVCPPRAADESLPVAAQLELAQSRTLAAARIVTAIAAKGVRRNPRLWLVTRAAQQVDPAEPVTLAQAELRGLARVLVFEHPKLKTTTVDVDAAGSDSAAALAAEILALAEHDEVALRAGRRTVRRLVPAATTPAGAVAPESRKQTVEVGGPLGYRLEVDAPGRLDGLGVHAVKRPVPQDNQVEIAISLAGLNFADVLKTMGLYPGLRGRAPVIGAECVGVVSAVGDRAGALRVGQRVLALGPGTFGSHLLTSADLVVPIPEQLSDDQAATFGAAYLTAWHSLCEVARLAPGERVLIHSATGGVGLAAIEVARLLGARIYTTAGSQTKRTMLSDMGVEYVGDSRSTAFAAEILDLTAGEGVDVVLNSLAGEAISAGVEVLAPGGRFVELGKKDVHGDGRLVLSGLARSASFAVVDLDLNLRLHPARYRGQLEQILGHAAAGDLAPLPLTVFEFADATEAFRLLASGNHIGKVAISMPRDGSVLAAAPPPPAPLVAADGGYIVVGGLGGLGLVTARWLADNGAGTVVLSGRSAPDADTAAAIAEMNRGGTRVEVVAGDIADASTAARLVEAVDAAGYRLAGVVHSAMVLDDEIVSNMSEAAAARVFAAKVAGGWHLHTATAGRDLDWWLAYSSAASLLGSPGQGAYAAANSWLDGLVAYRRAHGLPAVGINWGPWAEVGRAQFFAGLGFDMISKAQGLQAIEELLAADRCRTGVLTLDSRQWFQSFPSAAGSALFARLRDAAPAQDRGGSIRAELDALDAGKRPARLASAISDEICAVLRSTRPIGHHEAMNTLGLDSLMALELRNRLETALGITLPAALVWAYPTIADLAVVLGERMGYQDDDVPGTAEAEEPVAAQGESALSDEEMELLSGVVKASELEAMTGATES